MICADDSHGTPIMISAHKKGITPETLIHDVLQKHVQVFEDFQISYDHYSTTHSKANRELCTYIYEKIRDEGHIVSRKVEQYFCEKDKLFLPDRFVKGTCPRCGSEDQYGDGCDKCGATYMPTDLKTPRCSLCASTPVMSSSEQYFIQLEDFRDFLQEWVPQHTNESIARKLQEWLDEKLRDWCISRDAPYFGFEIPDCPGKFFYVWFEAPIGYMSSTKEWCEKNGRSFDEFWKDSSTEIYHNIGKDIVYFHALFWPAMLSCAGFTTPKDVWVHGMLTLNGEKMSKSKGTFINARPYLNHLAPEYFRFYLASKLSPGIIDIDLNFQDFVARVNSDLIGKITNVASRSAQLLEKRLEGRLGILSVGEGLNLVKSAQAQAQTLAEFYETRQFAKAILCIRDIADSVNKYFDDHKPWLSIDEEPEKVRVILTCTLNVFRIMSVYLKPVLPEYVRKVESLFGDTPYVWKSAQTYAEDKTLQHFVHLLNRVDEKAIDRILEESKNLI
jgi:methionyl-tRNA synthetase